MSNDKCFCHLNGYAVKDATARKQIVDLDEEVKQRAGGLWDGIGIQSGRIDVLEEKTIANETSINELSADVELKWAGLWNFLNPETLRLHQLIVDLDEEVKQRDSALWDGLGIQSGRIDVLEEKTTANEDCTLINFKIIDKTFKGEEISSYTSTMDFVGGINMTGCSVGDLFYISNDVNGTTFIECVPEQDDYIEINPTSYDFITGSVKIEPNKTYKINCYSTEVYIKTMDTKICVQPSNVIGDIETALDSIIAIQNTLIGGVA